MFALHCVRTQHTGVAVWLLLCLAALAACSNGRGSLEEGEQDTGFTLGGTATGLSGSGLVLQNNGGSNLALVANGPFTFTGSLANGTAYSVTVLTQPSNPTQTCTVANGSGTIAAANITTVAVTCATGTFAVRGTVTGLTGSGLLLRNNGGDDVTIGFDGEFGFATPIAAGSPYNVTVATQPGNPTQICTVTNGSGTMGQADVTNVNVTCATSAFAVSGNVTSLVGSGLVLQNNGADDLTIPQNGPFTFATQIASGAPYNVTVRTQPAGPQQTCTVANASGTVGSAPVTDVAVSCATNLFTIGGTVSGLAGRGLVLQVNGGDDRAVNVDGVFTFPTAVPDGTRYSVSVKTSPSNPSQTCAVANGSGTVAAAAVTNIRVTCTTNAFSIGGTVGGLDGTGLVLQNNGGDDLPIASNGSFTFSRELVSGATYNVTVRTQPVNKSQTCTVQNGNATVGGGDVRNVTVTCATNTYAIAGNVSGLLGSGLVLRNNGDEVGVESSGAFRFARKVASGGNYNVTIGQQPSNPTQACTVANGSGTVTAADITNVSVTCTTSEFSIGGSVQGLQGSGLVLRNNGTDDLSIGSDGGFTFATPLPSGTTYSVTVAANPLNPVQACSVTNGSGTVGGGNVTNVQVNCVRIGFSVGGAVSGLAGSGLVLQNNGHDNLPIAANGAFTLPATVNTGSPYNITVASQPSSPTQQCTVSNGSGTMGSGDITNVAVDCTILNFTIGGTVSGLFGVGLILQNNGADNVPIGNSGPFTFPISIPSGSTYNVTILSQPFFPSPQTCTVTSGGSGTVTDHNVVDVTVTC
jgi:large repetitive protein